MSPSSAAALVVALSTAACSQEPKTPAAVGFSVAVHVDSARPSPAYPSGRPLQLGVWYPAEQGGPPDTGMRYGTYVGLQGGESGVTGDSVATGRAISAFATFLSGAGLSDSAVAAVVAAPMRGVPGLAPRRSRLPVVLLAAGNGGTIADLAFLGEEFAANGYLAVGLPSPTRLGDTLASEADIGTVARAQAQDLAFALRTVRRDRELRLGPIAVAGYSFGARGALLFALADTAVRAVVSLDGGVGSATGQESMGAEIGAAAAGFQAPLLHIYERRDAFMRPDFTLLRSLLPARISTAEAAGLGHVHFSSIGDLAVSVPMLAARTGAPADLAAQLARTRRTVLWFLDRELKRGGRAAPDSGLAIAPLR